MQRTGGIAALICGATYVFGFALLLAVLLPAGFGVGGQSPAESLSAVAENRVLVQLWYFVIYIVNAIFLAVLASALAGRIAVTHASLGRLTLTFGTIWATLVLGAGMVMNVGLSRVLPAYDTDPAAALPLWEVVDLVENGLGGGNEIAGGVWVLTLGIAGLVSGALPRVLSILSLVIGVAGLSTVIAPLAEVGGSIFGLGFILWFFWTGAVLLIRP